MTKHAPGTGDPRQLKADREEREALDTEASGPPESAGDRQPCLVVGVGASAGGLEAFTLFLSNLPVDTGMAFVLIQHLDPTQKSLLAELLGRMTRLPVSAVSGQIRVAPNHVYVMPPQADLTIIRGILTLVPRLAGHSLHKPIDFFLSSLAQDQGERARGVLLSGTGSDGSRGLAEIKAMGGMTYAQDMASAKYGEMPHQAVLAGAVDYVLPPAAIARELTRAARLMPQDPPPKRAVAEDPILRILPLLRQATGSDFSSYKSSTIKRRLTNRLAKLGLADLDEYIRYIQDHPVEIRLLHQELLIKVTSFFREPEMYAYLKREIYPQMSLGNDVPCRIWVPGCATGEEAYSIAITLREFAEETGASFPIQIFATDIDSAALEQARSGLYPETIAKQIGPERLSRFFDRVDGGYRVSGAIRDLCVFAKQNVIYDPPFSRLDLISCRNVLIYLGLAAQKRVLAIFHYALKPQGYLILGSSESAGAISPLFGLTDKRHQFHRRLPIDPSPLPNLQTGTIMEEKGMTKVHQKYAGALELEKEADHLALARYAPAGVIVNEQLEIISCRGRSRAFLEPAPGSAGLRLLKMVRPSLLPGLRAALRQVQAVKKMVRKESLPLELEGDRIALVNLEIHPLSAVEPEKPFYLVLFEEVAPGPAIIETILTDKAPKGQHAELKAQVKRLEQDLSAVVEYQQALIEQRDKANEELRAANEEILSNNEELQSMHEEMQTAKEELQASNEELVTINEELHNRNLELTQANNDVISLLGSVDIPIVMVDNDLRIKRLTSVAQKTLNLLITDIGRPISDIRPNLLVPDLEILIRAVLETLDHQELEVQDRQGRWYSLRIRPYRSPAGMIEGALLIVVDIDSLRSGLESMRNLRDQYAAILDTVREPMLVLNGDLRVWQANRSFLSLMQATPKMVEGKSIFAISGGAWDIPSLRVLLEQVLPKKASFYDYEVDQDLPGIGRRKLLLNARQVTGESDVAPLILLAFADLAVKTPSG